MMQDNVWFDKFRVDDAEKAYQEHRAREVGGLVVHGVGLGVGVAIDSPELAARLSAVERENAELRQVTADLQEAVKMLTARVNALDKGAQPPVETKKPAAPVEDEDDDDDDDDDDIDLFGSDTEEDKEALAKVVAKRKEEEEQTKKKAKPAVVAKSSIILYVKPWDDETNMDDIEKVVREVQTDGLVWGASKLVPVGYGIKKLQICCVVEDDKVGTDFLEEEITKHEDLVQSVDIAAFNKI